TLTSTAQHRALHSFPTRRSSDLAEGRFDALLRPRLQLAGKRVVEGEQQPPVRRAQQRAAVLRALGEGQQVEGGRRAAQLRHGQRSEEHTSELQSRFDLVCRLLLE